MRRNRESISIPWSPWLVLVWPIRWRSQPSSQDQPQPHLALAELLITGHQSGGGEAQPGPSSLHLLEQLLPDGGLAGDAAKPHLLPSALAPTLSRSQVQEKVEPRSHLSSPVSSQVNTKQILWINEFHSDSGEAVFVIIHIFILPIVQDIFENYYFNKRELNEPTYFSYDRHGKNSLLL